MSHSYEELLCHILDEINFLIAESSVIDENTFMRDEKAKRAFVRSLEIIGEATKSMPEDFILEHPEIEWKMMARMRDKLIHHYFGVDYGIVWDTVTSDILSIKNKILKISS